MTGAAPAVTFHTPTAAPAAWLYFPPTANSDPEPNANPPARLNRATTASRGSDATPQTQAVALSSRAPSRLPSGLKATETKGEPRPASRVISAGWAGRATFHTSIVPFGPAAASSRPSGLK